MLNKLYRRPGTRRVLVQAEPAGKFVEADCDAGLAGAHALEQGGLLGVGSRLLPLGREQVAHPRGRLIQRCCHGGSIPHGGTADSAGGPLRGILLKACSG
jgi:hypothetical protein